jgi:hypothetical protein
MFYIPVMLKTRGDLLKFALSGAIKAAASTTRAIANTVMLREGIAEDAVDRLRQLPDDPWKLAEPLPQHFGVMSDLGASTPVDWHKPKRD